MSVHLMRVHPIGVSLTDIISHAHVIDASLEGVPLVGVPVIYESSLRAGPGWRESLYRHQGWFEASDCGRLGRQAAGHPWSALRVVKSCRKTAQRPRCCRSQSSSSASKVVPELTI